MHKKLITVAIAGALTTPTVVFAQASTVQIYGLFNVEYGINIQQPNHPTLGSRHDAKALNSNASRIGFKGEEALGNSLSAFFQYESNVRFLTGNTDNTPGTNNATTGILCDRNSTIGLKDSINHLYINTWDTPIDDISNVTRITNTTDWISTENMTLVSRSHPTHNPDFATRAVHSVNYDTPKFDDFSTRLQYTIPQATRNTLERNLTKEHEMSIGNQYTTGPLAIVTGYSRRDDNITISDLAGTTDQTWLIGASYVFGPMKVGLNYADLD